MLSLTQKEGDMKINMLTYSFKWTKKTHNFLKNDYMKSGRDKNLRLDFSDFTLVYVFNFGTVSMFYIIIKENYV